MEISAEILKIHLKFQFQFLYLSEVHNLAVSYTGMPLLNRKIILCFYDQIFQDFMDFYDIFLKIL
jgi:hypothetical protein